MFQLLLQILNKKNEDYYECKKRGKKEEGRRGKWIYMRVEYNINLPFSFPS